ncbi:MAG: metal ABC transporter substrate-binding protein [Thermoleophilaceae bacterium]
MRARLLLLAALLAAGMGLAACGDEGSSGEGSALTVVATTPHVADLVQNVGGGRVEVETIVPAEADPHGYEPRPSDVAALADAGLVVRSGGDLDEWLDEVLDSAGAEAQTATLMDSMDRLGSDPHWWQDPRNAILAVRAIEARLTEADPEGGVAYRRNAERYVERLRKLDAGIAACVARVPPEERRMVTTHDSLGYLARRYGIEVVGAVIPSLSTQAQASAGDVDRLVDQIRAERVKAIFPESAVSAKLEEAIAREAGAAVGRPLYADSLGPEGTEAGSYLGALAANASSLVEGMSGGRVRCVVRP